jgi:hypothetical protein
MMAIHDTFSLFTNTLLILSGIYHGVVGLFATISVSYTRKIGKFLYNIKIPKVLDPRYEYALKPIGGYALFVSSYSFYGAMSSEPSFRKFVCVSIALLIFSRGIQRLAFAKLVENAFSLSSQRNRTHVGINFAIAACFAASALFQ